MRRLQYGYVFRERKRDGERTMINNVIVLRNAFDVVYETKGTECVRVFLPEGVSIPEDWDSWTIQDKDEWLFENQEYVNYKWKDVDRGDVVQIQELR
jgi:hypothetical protein